MIKTLVFTILPGLITLLLSAIGCIFKNPDFYLSKKFYRSHDEMVFGHHWIALSLSTMILLSRLIDEGKWNIPYISTNHVSYFFTISTISLIIMWLFSIIFLKYLHFKGGRLLRRHIINFFGVISIFTLSYALSCL